MSQGGYMIIHMDMSSYAVTDVTVQEYSYEPKTFCPFNQPALWMNFLPSKHTIPTSLTTINIDDFLVKMNA
jgi:hypothetical protein